MHILKFTQGSGELPTTYYLEEAFGFNDIQFIKMDRLFNFVETFGLKSIQATTFLQDLIESIGFNEWIIDDNTMFIETFGFNEDMYKKGLGEAFETIGFEVIQLEHKIIKINIEENMGFIDSGYHWLDEQFDMIITWRTRTKTHPYGYGASEYGAIVSYGDGSAPELVSFIVKCYANFIDEDDDNLVRTEVITINDINDPDADASFTYTVVMNLSDNGSFNWDMIFAIYCTDNNGEISPVQIANFELFNKVEHED